MKLFEISVTGLKEVIDLKAENDELNRGVGDLVLLLVHKDRDVLHDSLKQKDSTFGWCIQQVYGLIEENKKLKENHK